MNQQEQTWDVISVYTKQQAIDDGLIYHGSHDNGGDGSFPTLSVTLSPTHGWQIHT